MNALEKLNALQAGELNKVLYHTEYNLPMNVGTIYSLDDVHTNAAKVEVTKAVLDEYLRTGDRTLITTLQKAL